MEGQGPPGSPSAPSSQEGLWQSPAKGFAAPLALPPAASPCLPPGAHRPGVKLQSDPSGSSSRLPSPSALCPRRSQVCDGGLQSVLWVLMESSKAATGLACSPRHHRVLVGLRQGGPGPLGSAAWGSGERGARAHATSRGRKRAVGRARPWGRSPAPTWLRRSRVDRCYLG